LSATATTRSASADRVAYPSADRLDGVLGVARMRRHSESAPDRPHRYCVFGLTISSELPLPELSTNQPSENADELAIRLDRVPETLTSPSTERRFRASRIEVCGDEALVVIDKVARYLIRAGREIIVDPVPEASDRTVRLFLLGSTFGVLCHQRGLLPLHANAVVANGEAVAFCGRAGIGKSTLAAHFQARGYQVLCDDVCVVSFDADGSPLAWPGLPRLKLWRDAAEKFGRGEEMLERAVDGLDKFHVPLTAAARGPYPLSHVYVLSNLADGGASDIVRLLGKNALQAIMTNTYRKIYLKPMGLIRANFFQAAALAKRAAIFAAPRRRGFDVFAEEAARLECHLTGQAGARVARSARPVEA
jgi:hypothetical protein